MDSDGARKICLFLTSRGNYAKMRSVMQHILADSSLELQVVVGGGALLSSYGDIARTMAAAGLPVHRRIHFLVEGGTPVTMAKSAGLAVTECSTALDDLRPDVVVVIADRFECLPMAMTAAYMNIPVAHVEGGEVTGSIDESIRHAITKLAHLHFPANEEAARRIQKMGEDPTAIFAVGATSLDAIAALSLDDLSFAVELQQKEGSGPVLDFFPGSYLVVIQHPVTTEYEDNLRYIQETIDAIQTLHMPTVWIWPNMDAGSDGLSLGLQELQERRPQYIHFFKGLSIESYAPLLKNAACLVGNSSSGIRESAFLGVPTVNVGSRQSGRLRGKNVIDVANDRQKILQAIREQLRHGAYPMDSVYGDGRAGQRIVEVLRSAHFSLQKKITY